MKKDGPNIKIEDQVLDYLSKKNKDTLTLTVKTTGGGCCPTIEIAEIEMKKPDNEALYKYSFVYGIHIFISKKARISAPVLKFILRKNLFTKEIIALGLSLKSH